MGTCTAMSSRKVIAWDIASLSLLLNTPLSGSSQQSLVQEVASSMPVSSQNALTSGETPTSCAFPFGYCHCQPHTASPTLCKAWEYALNHKESSTFSSTSSRIINCPMLSTVRAGRQMSHPWTLILHHQMVRRCLASERAAPLAPTINSVMSSYQGTSSSEMPWTTNCSQQVVLQVGSTVLSISSPHQCLSGTLSAALGFLWNIPAFPQLKISSSLPPATLCGGLAYAEFGNHPPMPHSD